MKENSIEEDIIKIEGLKYLTLQATIKGKFICAKVPEDYIQAIEHILSDYKRVLKENEELLQEKINNQKMIALAQNEALGYMQGYEDGKKHKMTAMTQIVENQQYHIIKKQMEKYEEHIKKLQKENEELKNGTRRNENELEVSIDGDWDALKKALDEAEKTNEYIIYDNGKWIKEKYCIPVQEVKDKIEELKEQYNVRELDFIKTTQDIRKIIIQSLEELIEGRE